jgi:hypothetical protein
MAGERDEVYRRIVVEYGRWYAYVYMTDSNGKVLEDESFKQPFRLDWKDSADEARECWQFLYQYLQDTVLWYSTARDDDPPSDSGKTPEK